MIKNQARRHGVPFYYCNAIGGNDELVFDGHSLAVHANGELEARLPGFEESHHIASDGWIEKQAGDLEDLRRALVLGVRDYATKCGFESAVLGLSGGIDSAVVACLAVEALGASQVTGVAMPSPFSSSHSVEDAMALAENLSIACLNIPIGESFDVFKKQMLPVFGDRPEDATEENMQARLRGLTLMALSNKFGHLLLTTGNKSELAVGYCTLYGDMAGGLAAISDVPKTVVYQLAEHLNRDRELIPRRTIEKPPSAELRPDQKDQDTLPPYEVLDAILKLYVEDNLSPDEIIAAGFEADTVRWVLRKVDFNEYKRKQAAPGLKITSRAFGMGRRMPIAQRFFSK
jgi:NAD+ synthetase